MVGGGITLLLASLHQFAAAERLLFNARPTYAYQFVVGHNRHQICRRCRVSMLSESLEDQPATSIITPKKYKWRSSAVKFWRFDLSCGAGALSSPIVDEHPRDAAEIAVLAERGVARAVTWFPRWFLLSAIGIISRELASRQVREYLVPDTLTSEAQPKAKALSDAFRKNLDTRVTKILSGGKFGELNSIPKVVNKFVQAELEELEVGASSSNVSHLTSLASPHLSHFPSSHLLLRGRSPPSRTCCATR